MDPLIIAALASTGVNLARGIGSNRRAKRQRAEYDAYESSIPERDPEQIAFMGEVRRNRNAFMSGTDPISAWTRQQAMTGVAQTQNNLLRMGRGSVSDMLRAQRVGDTATGAAGARAAQTGIGLLGMEGTLQNALADRAFQTRWARANRRWSEYAQSKEDANSQILAGLKAYGGGGAERLLIDEPGKIDNGDE